MAMVTIVMVIIAIVIMKMVIVIMKTKIKVTTPRVLHVRQGRRRGGEKAGRGIIKAETSLVCNLRWEDGNIGGEGQTPEAEAGDRNKIEIEMGLVMCACMYVIYP